LKHRFFAFRSNYSYEEALRFQGILNSEEYTGLLAFEPQECITIGRGSSREVEVIASASFLQDRGMPILSTDRGGKTSYQGPGQLLGFPIVNLNTLYGDPRAVKRFSEELLLGLAHACAVLGVKGVGTRADAPGLWTNRGLLASVGISVKDGYIFHGFALHVYQSCTPGFSLIHPGGEPHCPVTTLEQEGVRIESIEELATRLLPYLSVIQGDEVYRESKTVSYESTYTNLVSTVSRSQMAIEHFRTNLESIGNRE
jgi:lipoyl(octanoyl) transferase